MASPITALAKASKAAYAEHKEKIADILLFGSLVRGKEKPNDIDILILFKKKIDKDVEYDINKRLRKIDARVAVISKTSLSLQEPSFSPRDAILFEGYSLVTGLYIASSFGFSSFGLFQYQTKGMSNTQKTKFYYALNGRRTEGGSIKRLHAIKWSDNSLLVPLGNIEKATAFFDYWGIKHQIIQLLLPSRLAKEHILQKK